MKTNGVLLRAIVGATVLAVFAPVVAMGAGDFKPCCKDGSSPYASESRDTFKSNSRAGYQGSELPPSTGFNPDHIDRYSNPENSIYNQRAAQPAEAGSHPSSHPKGTSGRQPGFTYSEEIR